MVAEKSISVDIVKLALLGMWIALSQLLDLLGSIQAKQIVQPLLDRVIEAIPDWLVELDFFELSSLVLEAVLLGLTV